MKSAAGGEYIHVRCVTRFHYDSDVVRNADGILLVVRAILLPGASRGR